ncbi:MAG: methylenetetrahydrofolate--tRNA-(uracil(54)-C(5))-methyltransferase (FADH(2)-oxidizing) TrmFO [Myxococcales bacterium]|nr:methylenetetrahydrofolate--tRNA-(uracil(54)-C(5))-methyltransferase (FADH(2)-oxidizing) TrmFO [Myxococcales bacterium]
MDAKEAVGKDLPVWVVGGGLAGCEVALQLSRRGIPVRLIEMKPKVRTPAQVSDHLAELVCSNSFRGAALNNAVGALKEEMRMTGGALIAMADATQIPAGGALAVDREAFAHEVETQVRAALGIELITEELVELPSPDTAPIVVLATGPLTTEKLSRAVAEACGGREHLYFYDAIAPIVAADSIDMSVAFRGSRYGKGEGDEYLNLPLDEEAYRTFVAGLLAAEKVVPRDFEEARYFEGCLPIEVMAARGIETLRYGCMKPVGLPDPRTGKEAHAVVQLRPENPEHTAYNMVGFQTRMKWGAQKDIFSQLPGMSQVEFLRMGSIHRNTYIESPVVLNEQLQLKPRPQLYFAGQITGVEGYVESIACGLLLSWLLVARLKGFRLTLPPPESTLGALYRHILGKHKAESGDKHPHVPSNIHWGLLPSLKLKAKKSERKRLAGERAVECCRRWWEEVRTDLG